MSLGWFLQQVTDPVTQAVTQQHVCPVDDLKPHFLSPTCPCHPEEDDEAVDLWRHNSYDGREAHEGGRALN